mmetsp:Transcript_541/g.630  ORF Transcript_541/g.630 Transcript_541/m.630 type:complete len:346 (+) Transcript_541:143-1180(+)
MSKYQQSSLFIKKLGLEYPIIQSPMAGISTVKLASVISSNGGLGSIPLASVDARKQSGIDSIIKQLNEFKSLAKTNVVNLNFFCHDYKEQKTPTNDQTSNWHKLLGKARPNISQDIPTLQNSNISLTEVESIYPELFSKLLEKLVEFKPKVVSFHFGFPSQSAIKFLQENGVMVFVSVTSVKEAEKLIDLKVDGLVSQGYEAGGHRGNFLVTERLDENLSTFSLFTQIKKLVDNSTWKPFIIPAGGIMDGKTIENYLANGASGVQLGTIFLSTPESTSNDYIKNVVSSSDNIPTIMTRLVSGKPARCLRTPFIQDLIEDCSNLKVDDQPSYGYAYYGYKTMAGVL